MNVQDLRDLLEDIDGDVEVRVGYQPNWPLRATLANVVTPDMAADVLSEDVEEGDDEGDDPNEEEGGDASFLWLVLSDSAPYDESPYAPRAIMNA